MRWPGQHHSSRRFSERWSALGLSRRRPIPPFGKDFRFGVATADHQCEAFDPASPDIWDQWEAVRDLPLRRRATDFWNRYPEDVKLARGIGVQVFRFSVSWTRIEPQPGVFDHQVLAHYRDMVDAITAAGMSPLVTLHHFVWPPHIEARGGMISPDFPQWFAHYAAEVVKALGPAIDDWITFNEPNLLCFGYFRPWWQRAYSFPPGLPLSAGMSEQLDNIAALIRNIFQAHTQARAAIKRVNPGARVGSNPSVIGLPTWLQAFIDRRLASTADIRDYKRRYRGSRRRRIGTNSVSAVISSFSITNSRQMKVDFTSAYLTAGLALMVKASDVSADPGDFSSRLGVLAGSTAQGGAAELIPHAQAVAFDDRARLFAALDDGTVDGILGDDVQLLERVAKSNGSLRLLDRRLTTEPYGIATVRGSGLLDPLEAALRDFRTSGQLVASIAKNLPGYQAQHSRQSSARHTLADKSAAVKGEATKDWRGYVAGILGSNPLRIAVSTDVPGLGWRDPQTGEWSGLEIDLARHIGAFLLDDPARLELVPVKSQERIPKLTGFRGWLQLILEPLTVASAVVCTNWWHLGMAGKLPEFLCPADCVGQQDFAGFDYYWGIGAIQLKRVRGLMKALTGGDFSDAPIWVGGLGDTLRYYHRLLPDLPLFVIENGSIGNVDGVDRATYIREHLREAQRELAHGIPLKTFVVWSITDNREWNSHLESGSDFGLYSVDLDNDPTLTRNETSSVGALRDIVTSRTAMDA